MRKGVGSRDDDISVDANSITNILTTSRNAPLSLLVLTMMINGRLGPLAVITYSRTTVGYGVCSYVSSNTDTRTHALAP